MSILATCATLAALLASAQGGETINLQKGSNCPAVTIRKVYPRQVTVNAGGSTVRGLTLTGSNIRWRSGTVRAPHGAFASGPNGYGIKIAGKRIVIDGVLVTDARKGIVVDQAERVTITRSRFLRLGEDGVIASRVLGLAIMDSRFEQTVGKATSCVAGGLTTYGVPKRDCAGTWADGTHADAIQLRNAVRGAIIERNVVRGETQGIGQMDSPTDAPLEQVVIRDNDIETVGYHQITLTNCIGCRIENNRVRRAPGSAMRAIIRHGMAVRCGNVAPDDQVKDRPC